jgi:hypothetical protein
VQTAQVERQSVSRVLKAVEKSSEGAVDLNERWVGLIDLTNSGWDDRALKKFGKLPSAMVIVKDGNSREHDYCEIDGWGVMIMASDGSRESRLFRFLTTFANT